MNKKTKTLIFQDMQTMINEYDGCIDGCLFDENKIIIEFDADWGRVTLSAIFKEKHDAE